MLLLQDRVHPWSLISQTALGTGISLEQVLRKRRPSFCYCYQFHFHKTVRARDAAARQWLRVLLSGLGNTSVAFVPPPPPASTGWPVTLSLVLVTAPHPSATSCCHELLLAEPQNLRTLGENSPLTTGTVTVFTPGQGTCSVLVLCPL